MKELHLAAQYLSAAGISFLLKSEDDSHINLGWSVEKQELSTWVFSHAGDQLALSVKEFALVWLRNDKKHSNILLDGKSHVEVLNWINKNTKEAGLGVEYRYHFHYKLPYAFPSDDFIHQLGNAKELEEFSKAMDVAQGVFSEFALRFLNSSSVRLWPHHFDLGVYIDINQLFAIELGLAISDSNVDELYYYVFAHQNNSLVETQEFSTLPIGEWKVGDWKSAVLKAKNIEAPTVTSFLEATVNAYLSKS